MAYQIPRGTQDVYGDQSYKWQQLERIFVNSVTYTTMMRFEHQFLNTQMYSKERMTPVIWSIKRCTHSNLKTVQLH